ncbi:Adenylosuccinate synthetase, organellar chromatophore [Streptomyces alboniger]
MFNRRAIEAEQIVEQLLEHGENIKQYVADTTLILNNALDEDKVVLFEGGQGTLLDVDHGTYPFVTSSNPTAGGACTGTGVGPTKITRVIGILKAYTTRVGAGPFPTELFDQDGEDLRRIGGERGVTTGRDRRCGWFDAPIARYATRVNGLTDFFLTKLDVLTRLGADPGLRRVRDRRQARRGAPVQPDRLPPREAGLRVPPRLVRGHHQGPDLLRPAEERAGLREGPGGDVRRPDLRDRRGPGPHGDDRDQLVRLGGLLAEPLPAHS